jgi:chromodomain-helicase-DNA-binding protein 7
MAPTRRSRDTSNGDASITPPENRRSSRSNKFKSSFKEPTEAIRDLLLGTRATVKPKKRTIDNISSDDDSDESRSESPSDDNSDDEISLLSDKQNRSRKKQASSPKSPAVKHATKRRQLKTEDLDESSFTSDDDSDEDDEPMKIQRIIGCKSETLEKWNKICKSMNTSEVEDGSRWFQEDKSVGDENKYEKRYLVKWSDFSFLHCSWETEKDLLELVENSKTYLSTFQRKSHNGYLFDADERMDGEFFDPSYIQIERILEVSSPDSEEQNELIFDKSHPEYDSGTGRQFLIKWGNLPYTDSTYEFERDLILMEVEYEDHVRAFQDRQSKPTKLAMKKAESTREATMRQLYKAFGEKVMVTDEKETLIEEYKKKLEDHIYRNGGQLRDYQAEGVAWLLSNHVNKRCSILADEMGLGKTIQTATYVERLASDLKLRGPFLVVAPLSTIPHWYREFTGWTSLNTIIYHGSAQDRATIREYEFAFECDRPTSVGFNQRYLHKVHKRNALKWIKTWMVDVVITTPEMLVTEDFHELTAIDWELLIVDEAHRLKNHASKLAANLRHENFVFRHKLLLTGTPIQNNMNELWTLMNIVDPDMFSDLDEFMDKFGNMRSKDHVDNLHDSIRPYILRRLKEDVEKSVPPKEETLIEVELTVLQKQYYRALFEKNVGFLHRGVKKALDGPSINNLAMQLRKCCNHPFLLRGVEEQHVLMNGKSMEEQADILVKASGKLVLLDKLLPRLKEGGHRVLIFSQFKMMLDVLEDYLNLRSFRCERIDGSITGKKRQMAIDRFQAKDNMDSSFIMLLSTRAGGVGINLTAADTCIIFDSDWNPQNDLQAQARCHRIGQTKSVKIYRLLSRKTYEMQMFHMSSLKMGLDQAVLQGIENNSADESGKGNMTKEEVEKLLRHGAYDIFAEDKAGTSEQESKDFIELDIDSILERRSRKVVHDNGFNQGNNNNEGSTFSKASFKAQKAVGVGEEIDVDDPDFWEKVVGVQKLEDSEDLSGKKRSRNKTNYTEVDEGTDDIILDDMTSEDEMGDDEISPNVKVSKNKIWGGSSSSSWVKQDVLILLNQLRKYGYGNMAWGSFVDIFLGHASKSYELLEIQRMCWSLCLFTFLETVEKTTDECIGKTASTDVDSETSPLKPVQAETDYKEKLSNNFRTLFSQYNSLILKVWHDCDKFSLPNSDVPTDVEPIEMQNSSSDLDIETMKTALEKKASTQLLKDRKTNSKIKFNRKILDEILYLQNAHELVNRVKRLLPSQYSKIEFYKKLSQIINVNAKGTLPHPDWNSFHDGVLVDAIAKHGWIGFEESCQEINVDKEITWGPPFEAFSSSSKEHPISTDGVDDFEKPSEENRSENFEEIKSVSLRVRDFLGKESQWLHDLTGFSLQAITDAYGIAMINNIDEDGTSKVIWEFDENILNKSLQNKTDHASDDDLAELPSRKDLMRRAKLILAKLPCEEPIDSGRKTHEDRFGLLNQTNRCNFFLSMLLNCMIHVSHKKHYNSIKLLDAVVKEAESRYLDTKGIDADNLKKIFKTVSMLKNYPSTKLTHRLCKNIFRVILGIEILFSPNDEVLFLIENKPKPPKEFTPKDIDIDAIVQSTQVKDCASGDVALCLSIMKAKQKSKKSVSSQDLLLSEIDVTILGILLGFGLPIFDSLDKCEIVSDDDYVFNWKTFGVILEDSVSTLMSYQKPDDGAILLEVNKLIRSKSEKNLIVRVIRLLESVRVHSGLYENTKSMNKNSELGLRALQWNIIHLIKWASQVDLVKDGRIAVTDKDDSSSSSTGSKVQGLLDKKACKSIWLQISQQTRLRSLMLESSEGELASSISTAVKNLKRNGDIWEKRPVWWEDDSSCDNDVELLKGIVQYGYGGFERMVLCMNSFRRITSEEEDFVNCTGTKPDVPLGGFNRASAQQRLNSLTKELSEIHATTMALKLLGKRPKVDINSSSSQIPDNSGKAPAPSGGTIQVGIQCFFNKRPKDVECTDVDSPSKSDILNEEDDKSVLVISP